MPRSKWDVYMNEQRSAWASYVNVTWNCPLTLYDLGEWISPVWPKFRFKKRRDHWKKILWAPRLWVGRR